MSYASDVQEFSWECGRFGMRLSEAHRVMRLAATVQRLSVMECNEPLSAAEQKRLDNAQRHLVDIGSAAQFKVEFGDPRSYVVRLVMRTDKMTTALYVPARSPRDV